MEVKEFLKTYQRMCEETNCEDCPFANELCDLGSSDCDVDKIVPVVEEWGKNHPIKTRQSEFFKMFPDAAVDKNGVPVICPKNVALYEYTHQDNPNFCVHYSDGVNCANCRKKFWMEEIE